MSIPLHTLILTGSCTASRNIPNQILLFNVQVIKIIQKRIKYIILTLVLTLFKLKKIMFPRLNTTGGIIYSHWEYDRTLNQEKTGFQFSWDQFI